ncbi:IPT/TIG domain-containing protein,collagen triple helix repeat protein [Terriglobus roseus DSM 18391]|uniref:IPT/TIG domain-containing protein,collagen triple helix repeat protein n=1 Tax=Terriglobus roseus (strain DSM 18391 / NRRL B-41598 / KBS 63) TaxID=926566 RepID=I3ZMK6_TERRK|nr:collagen-like triple helix repeat-containing protein [Terriglobus roseus]AFL90474.1 IPT/TIG domain-containing protein,collagen triple helix repeat protein [Terriglobus roseus DSM 18391]
MPTLRFPRLLPVVVVAASAGVANAQPFLLPAITSVSENASGTQIVIAGFGFGNKPHGVTIGGTKLTVTAETSSSITAQLPVNIAPGSYLLTVVGQNSFLPLFFAVTLGTQGVQGATGPAGLPGLPGPAGPAGVPGRAGLTGATGPVGPAGATGLTGAAGPVGPAGAAGPIGLTGATGPVGPAGATGPVGPAGAAGTTGPVGPAGAAGPIGLTGLAGPQGATGATGPIGLTGPQGTAGVIGPAGPSGPTGPQGTAGPLVLNGNTTFPATVTPSQNDAYVGTLTGATTAVVSSTATLRAAQLLLPTACTNVTLAVRAIGVPPLVAGVIALVYGKDAGGATGTSFPATGIAGRCIITGPPSGGKGLPQGEATCTLGPVQTLPAVPYVLELLADKTTMPEFANVNLLTTLTCQ